MNLAGKVLFLGSLACVFLIVVITAIAGLWTWALIALILGVLLGISGPFVLGARWRPEEPRRRARPVSRRRR